MCPPELLDTGTPSRKDAPCGGEWLSRAVRLYPSRFFSFSRNRQNWTANASQSSKSLNSKRHGISGIPRENGPSSFALGRVHSQLHPRNVRMLASLGRGRWLAECVCKRSKEGGRNRVTCAEKTDDVLAQKKTPKNQNFQSTRLNVNVQLEHSSRENYRC